MAAYFKNSPLSDLLALNKVATSSSDTDKIWKSNMTDRLPCGDISARSDNSVLGDGETLLSLDSSKFWFAWRSSLSSGLTSLELSCS